MIDQPIEWVTVTTDKGGHAKTLTTVAGLAEHLLAVCPDAKAAQQACLDALEGRIAPDEARVAFVAAITGAGYHLIDLKRPPRRRK